MCNASSATRDGRRASRSTSATGGSKGSATRFARSPRPATAPVMRAARNTSFSAIALSRSSASVPGVWRPTEPTIMSQPLSRSPPGLVSRARRRTPSPESASMRRPAARPRGPACQSSASWRSSASEMSSTRSRSSRPRTRTPWCSSWNNGREMAAPPLNVETMSSRTLPSGSSMTVVVSSAPSRRSRMAMTSSRRDGSSSQVRNRYGVSSVIQSRRPGSPRAATGEAGVGAEPDSARFRRSNMPRG